VQTILVAAEAPWVRDLVRATFTGPDQRVVECERGQDVRRAVAELGPDLVILDLQIGNMGGVAVALDLRLEAGEGRLPDTPIVLLVDREADRFLARRADVDLVLVKPVDPGILRRRVRELLEPSGDGEADAPPGVGESSPGESAAARPPDPSAEATPPGPELSAAP